MDRKTLEQRAEYHFDLASRETDPERKRRRFEVSLIYFQKHAESYVESAKVEMIMGDKVEGGKYDISGQAAAVGPNAKAEGNVFAQVQVQGSDGIDLQKLAAELSTLANALRERASRPDAIVAAGKVAEAQVAAQKGDGEAAFAALSQAGANTLSTAKELGAEVASQALSRVMPKVASEQERERVIPWSQLPYEAYLEETEELRTPSIKRIWRNLEQYGICLVRLLGHPINEIVLNNIVTMIGFPAEDQNDYTGTTKDIMPDPTGRANSGDTTSELGFHVDGTQDPDQPAFLAFQYVAGATLGANSRFADAAGILASFDDDTRNEILVTLARSDAAMFSKLGMTYTGPIFSYSPTGSLMCRIRFDSVITVHEDCRRAYELLKERFESNFYSSMFLPNDGDVVVFDNWRVMHARDEIYGTKQRHHRRVWISLPRYEHQVAYKLGIRPISDDIAAKIREANAS